MWWYTNYELSITVFNISKVDIKELDENIENHFECGFEIKLFNNTIEFYGCNKYGSFEILRCFYFNNCII